MLNSQGILKTPSQSSYIQRGTSPMTIWYTGAQNQTAFLVAVAPITSRFLWPIMISRPVTLSKISFEVTTGGGAGSVARCGLYRSTSTTNIYPSTLVVDGGEQDTSGIGVKTTSDLSIKLSAGLYYGCYQSGVAAPTVRVAPPAGVSHILGTFFTTLALTIPTLSAVIPYTALTSTLAAGFVVNSTGSVAMAMEFA